MDRFDREIMDFVRSWAPYGGPPTDEILLEFGMTRDQLAVRVQQIVAAEQARHDEELRRPWVRMHHHTTASQARKQRSSGHRG